MESWPWRPRRPRRLRKWVAAEPVLGLAVDQAIHLGVAQDDLHVVARFGERDGLDQFSDLFVLAFGAPRGDAVFTGVVGRDSVFRSARGAREVRDVEHAQFDIVLGSKSFALM